MPTGEYRRPPCRRHAALSGSHSVKDPAGTDVLKVILHGRRMETRKGEVCMPGYAAGFDDVEIAAVANYVLGHLGGKKAAITPADVVAARR